jgi:hypothetical protein
MPTIVIGDFNSDPRDPRPNRESNPGGQPEASKACRAQVENPSLNSAIDTCNAYWLMRKAGFTDAGPDAHNAKNFTWGMSALLAGPDEKRFKAALMMGNNYGFTDRLDYIFLKNGAKVMSSAIVGNTWPRGSTWACSNEEQINNAALMADVMKVEMPPTRFCNDTDHASVVTQLSLPSYSEESDPLDPHSPFPISFWNWVGILLLISLSGIIYLRKRRI